jgi:hypothetical protein
MIERSERRRVVRLTIPWQHLTKPTLELRWVRLLDLSSAGARIEHPEPVPEGIVCVVDLPPTLGQARFAGRIVWTRLQRGEQTFEGDKQVSYQSGLAFFGLTPEQQTALQAALAILNPGN